jgi:hypothetical protein
MKRRGLHPVVCAAVGAAAGLLVVGYDGVSEVRWVGGKDVALSVAAPHPVRSVTYACCWNTQAAHYRELPPESRMAVWMADASVQAAPRRPDGSFLLSVRTGGTESGLGLLRNTYVQQTHVLMVVELETGERWEAELTLPDVRKATTATIRIPDDARPVPVEVAPVPRLVRGW